MRANDFPALILREETAWTQPRRNAMSTVEIEYQSGVQAGGIAEPRQRGGFVALGFAMTVAVWTVAYVCRMPMVNAPPQVAVGLMLSAVFAGGFFAGRRMGNPIRGGFLGGAVSGLLDILIIGAIFSDIRKAHSEFAAGSAVAMWVAGSVALNAVIAAAGAFAGSRMRAKQLQEPNWRMIFAWTLVVATFPLITAGGLVTAFGAGLAVPDWPNSFGYNMFLLPLSQMQGGAFYEHAHRLMGSLVGLTSLALTVFIFVNDKRWPVRGFAAAIFLCVCAQGLLGGLRVTGKFTAATQASAMAPSLNLAIVHGVFAQLVFGAMAGLAATCTTLWRSDAKKVITPAATTDRVMSLTLLFLMVAQLVLGALLRHKDLLVMAHITNAVFVTFVAAGCGIRAWGLYDAAPPIKRTGVAIMAIVLVQLLLGVGALIFREPELQASQNASAAHAISTTLHQANGALLMAACVTLVFWVRRLAAKN